MHTLLLQIFWQCQISDNIPSSISHLPIKFLSWWRKLVDSSENCYQQCFKIIYINTLHVERKLLLNEKLSLCEYGCEKMREIKFLSRRVTSALFFSLFSDSWDIFTYLISSASSPFYILFNFHRLWKISRKFELLSWYFFFK